MRSLAVGVLSLIRYEETTVLDVNQVASVDITIDGADEPVESLLHINTRIIAEDGELRVIKRKVK